MVVVVVVVDEEVPMKLRGFMNEVKPGRSSGSMSGSFEGRGGGADADGDGDISGSIALSFVFPCLLRLLCLRK